MEATSIVDVVELQHNVFRAGWQLFWKGMHGHCDVCEHKHIPARGSEGMGLFLRQSLDANVARILSLVLQTRET